MGNRSLFCDGLTLLIERVFDKVNTRLDHFVRAFECGFQFSAGQDGERPGCVVEINRVCGVHFWRSELVSNLYRRSCGFLGGEVGFCSLKAVPTCVVYDNLIVLGLSVNNLI